MPNKLRDLLSLLKNSKTLNILVLLVVITAIPFTVFVAQKQQEIRQRASGENFIIGFNLPGIIYYGDRNVLPASKNTDVDADLQAIQNMCGTIIRVFVANNKTSDQEAAQRLDIFLTKAQNYNISTIVTFIDFYGNRGFYPQGISYNRYDSALKLNLLGRNFFETDYKGRYKKFVETVVNKNKNHPNIYAWEIGNELKYENEPAIFVNFMKDISSYIKSLDPNHKISSGMLNTGHTNLTPETFYPKLPNIDIVTVRAYNGNHDGEKDVAWAKRNNKISLIEEAGFSGNSREVKYQNEINYWKTKGASAFLQWGFIAKGLSDNGDGDKKYGMDNLWHNDYDGLFSLFKQTVSCNPNLTSTKTPTLTPSSNPRISSAPTNTLQPSLSPTSLTPTFTPTLNPSLTTTPSPTITPSPTLYSQPPPLIPIPCFSIPGTGLQIGCLKFVTPTPSY